MLSHTLIEITNGISFTNHLYVFPGMLLLVNKCDQMSV